MSKDRFVAILAYLSLVGWICGYLLHQEGERSSLASFHLRQGLGIHILGLMLFGIRLLFIPIPFGAPVRALVDLAWVALFLALVQGAVHAYRGRERPIPLVGEFIQEYLRSIA